MSTAANPYPTADTTGDVRYAFAEGPAPGEAKEIAPGLKWVRIPLPIRLRIVNIWWLNDGPDDRGQDQWTAIDTGFHNEETKAIWQRLLTEHPLARLIITHYHPDHFGLAGWIQEQTGLVPRMPMTEWITGMLLARISDETLRVEERAFYHRGGMPKAMVEDQIRSGNRYARSLVQAPHEFRRIRQGDTLRMGGRDWRVLTGEGHCVEMAMFHCAEDKLFISADQILPKITPNTSIFSFMLGSDPLGEYVATLKRVKAEVPDDVLVLPSHRDPFYGLHSRIDTLIHHHEERLDHAMETFTGSDPLTAMDVCEHLFAMSTLDVHQRQFAYGEALAHVVRLVAEGRLRAETAMNGVVLYHRV